MNLLEFIAGHQPIAKGSILEAIGKMIDRLVESGELVAEMRPTVGGDTAGAPVQILANVEFQMSLGCVVTQALGTVIGSRRIAKAGTPIRIDFLNRQTAAVLANATVAMNAVLLHDVDVTDGNQNGTALIFGFVNVNRLEADVQTLVTAAAGNAAASTRVVFLRA